MKVLVTGGTGFIGAHTVAALQEQGHDVRLLVRSRDRIAPALRPVGVADVDAVEGDCIDRASVGRALQGCEAVVHLANVFTWNPRSQNGLVEINTSTTHNVLAQAVEAGLDPVVHVSSYVALDPAGATLTENSPVARTVGNYAGSKAAAELVARQLQEQGAPVVTTYPGMVIGPHDPYLGDSNQFLISLLARRPPVFGTVPCVDVRDVAQIHARAVKAGLGPRRFLATGHDITVEELSRRLGKAAGVAVTPMKVPPAGAKVAGRLVDLVRTYTPLPVQGSSGAVAELLRHTASDPRTTTDELGVRFRPLDETLSDTVAWLADAGHLERQVSPAAT